MHKYKLQGKRGEGTFSAVLKAQCTSTARNVAIKCMKNQFESVDQVNRLREIQALRRLSPHANIIKLFEVLYDRSTGRLALVFELMDMDLYELIKGRKQYLPDDKVLHIMYQLLRAIEHMHRNGIFHRDVKPENVLISGDTLKLADFGSCRGVYSKQPFTEYIATRWYRAPECLLTDGFYSYKMDLWGVGCVFFEIMGLYPLFPGTNELDQLHKIHKVVGTPSSELLTKLQQNSSQQAHTEFPLEERIPLSDLVPHAPAEAVDLMASLLEYDPEERITAKKCVRHPYFKEIRELDRQLRAQVKQFSEKEKQEKLERASSATNGEMQKQYSDTCSAHSVGTTPPVCAPDAASVSSVLPSLNLGHSIAGRYPDHGGGGGGVANAVPPAKPSKQRDGKKERDREERRAEREREKEKEKEKEREKENPNGGGGVHGHLPSIESGRKERKGSVDCLTNLGHNKQGR